MTTNILTAIVTAYVATGQPVAWNHPHAHLPTANHTIAIPRRFPLGSVVQIDGCLYLGEDRTAKKFDGRFDIFMSSEHAARNFGKQTKIVTIITKE
jgi:3D (Asp-Asp-Asp) domain-containing protein